MKSGAVRYELCLPK